MVNRLLFLILFLGLIAVVTFSTVKQEPTLEQAKQLIIPNNIDYYLGNTKQKSFKTDGSIDFTLNSTLLEHYKREDKSSLIDPDVHVSRENIWEIKAQQGIFFHPEEIITFNNNVRLDKISKTAPFHVFSHDLLLNIQQDLVISESNVKVTAESWKLNAKTMTLNMKNEIHQFTHVTARYRHDKTF